MPWKRPKKRQKTKKNKIAIFVAVHLQSLKSFSFGEGPLSSAFPSIYQNSIPRLPHSEDAGPCPGLCPEIPDSELNPRQTQARTSVLWSSFPRWPQIQGQLPVAEETMSTVKSIASIWLSGSCCSSNNSTHRAGSAARC